MRDFTTPYLGESDRAADILERRWFAAIAAAESMQSECEKLREVAQAAEAAWRSARLRYSQLQLLQDALADELGLLHGHHDRSTLQALNIPTLSSR